MSWGTRLFILLQYLLPHHLLSCCIGWLADCRWPFIARPLIYLFAKGYGIDLACAQRKQFDQYHSFNDFFTRELEADSRPIDPQASESSGRISLIAPADGCISQFGYYDNASLLQAKGITYTPGTLLGQAPANCPRLNQGQFITLYLAPSDYHRVHSPFAGYLTQMTYIPGTLFSVNQRTCENIPQLFSRNERLVFHCETDFGPAYIVMVGAMIVAGIHTPWWQPKPHTRNLITHRFDEAIALQPGMEIGRFYLGSTVICLLPNSTVHWLDDLKISGKIQMGEAMAYVNKS